MISLKAWAKINIGLKILDKREDGYHNIETTLATINLSDLITLKERESGIHVNAKGLDIQPEKNLCHIAAEIFRTRCGLAKGVEINLIKNIPVGGGLGGGSSDAACVLKGMNKFFAGGLSDEALTDMAKEIGSDVPFFIKGGAAYARGRGDDLKFFKLPRTSLIVYYPGYPISTQWAYEEYDKTILTPRAETNIIMEKDKKKKARIGFSLENDFEKVVFNRHPDLLDIKTNLLALGVNLVSLSGSGSCLFTMIDDRVRKKTVRYFEGIGAQFFEVSTL